MPVRLSSHRLPFSLSIGAAPAPPPITLGELFEIYYYDRDRALGSVVGGLILVFVWQSATGAVGNGDVQDSPDQASPIGTVIGGDIQDSPEQNTPIGTVTGGDIQDSPEQVSATGAIGNGTVQRGPIAASATGMIMGGTVLPPEYTL